MQVMLISDTEVGCADVFYYHFFQSVGKSFRGFNLAFSNEKLLLYRSQTSMGMLITS